MQHTQLQKISGQLPRVASFLITYSICSNPILYYRKVSGFTSNSKLCCPECEKEILVGTGGKANLQQHIRLRTWKAAISSRWQQTYHPITPFLDQKSLKIHQQQALWESFFIKQRDWHATLITIITGNDGDVSSPQVLVSLRKTGL